MGLYPFPNNMLLTQESEKEASDCNLIGPLGPAADRPAIKPVTAGESGCMDPSQTCQPLYTVTALGELAPTILL